MAIAADTASLAQTGSYELVIVAFRSGAGIVLFGICLLISAYWAWIAASQRVEGAALKAVSFLGAAMSFLSLLIFCSTITERGLRPPLAEAIIIGDVLLGTAVTLVALLLSAPRLFTIGLIVLNFPLAVEVFYLLTK